MGNSLALLSASTQYLNITGKTSASAQKFTISTWAKFASYSSTKTIFSSGSNTSNLFYLSFSSGRIFIFGEAGGSTQLEILGSTIYSDTTNWHHILVAMDTTQATASNRVQVYYDGTLVTAWTINNQPAQNANLSVNFSSPVGIGYLAANDAYFNGKLAQFYYIDGQQLSPSEFTAEIGSTLYATAYGGTYSGTFDSYLNFSNAGSLGADSSGEGNNWTPNNSPTQSTDAPVFLWEGTTVGLGSGSLSVTVGLALQALVSFSGTSFLSSIGVLGLTASAKYNGAGSLSYPGSLGLIASIALSDNSPSLSGYATINGTAYASLAGSGLVNVFAWDFPPGGLVSIFNAAGGLSANLNLVIAGATIRLPGSGSMSTGVTLMEVAFATFNGNGGMNIPLSGSSGFDGSGSLSVATIWNPRIGFFMGFGSLSVSGFRVIDVAEQFNGTGRMCVQATVRLGRGGPVSNATIVGPGQSFNITVGGG